MSYSVNQNVIFDGSCTGKALGTDFNSLDRTIVLLDRPLTDGTKAVSVPTGELKSVACHWCRDTTKVAVTPFTTEQYETNTIPTKECPYCKAV